MTHAIARDVPLVARDRAGPLHLAETTHTEWAILQTRDDRLITVRDGLTDPAEVHRELAAFRSMSRTLSTRVLERVITLHERLVDDDAVPPSVEPPAPRAVDATGPAATAVPVAAPVQG